MPIEIIRLEIRFKKEYHFTAYYRSTFFISIYRCNLYQKKGILKFNNEDKSQFGTNVSERYQVH